MPIEGKVRRMDERREMQSDLGPRTVVLPTEGGVHCQSPGAVSPAWKRGSGSGGTEETGHRNPGWGLSEMHRIERGMRLLPSAAANGARPRIINFPQKICVLGDSAVGKTSLIRRFALDYFDDWYVTTVGARLMRRILVLRYPQRSLEVHLEFIIWDITGHDRHLELHPAYYKGAAGALVVGDAARLETQVNLWKWIEGFRAVADRVPVMMLVNKTDILETGDFDYRLVEEIADEFGCPFRMTSARTGAGVGSSFRELGDRLVRRKLFQSFQGGRAC